MATLRFFYFSVDNDSRTFLHSTKFCKQPKRTKNWKQLSLLFNSGRVTSIGWTHSDEFDVDYRAVTSVAQAKSIVNDAWNRRFKRATLRKEISYRGGGIEISLESWGYPEGKMTAYQNYLGGGLLGSIQSAINPHAEGMTEGLKKKIQEKLKRYYYSLIGSAVSFEDYQKRGASAY
tara:strand:+ start:191 stop:718 length:528 start_codon:yes stop_codon:yes gene_type:complete